jgi:thiol-disulfide isomerase/thioredoxin
MIKKIIFSIVFFSQLAIGQNFVKGTMNPASNSYNWVILYQLKGAKQVYIGNSTLNNGAFNIAIPATAEKGMYRLMYKMDQKSHIDFIYNSENVALIFNPKKPKTSVKYLISEENKLYNAYLIKSSALAQKLDSLQLTYFNLDTKKSKLNLSKLYASTLKKYKDIQNKYLIESEGFIANHFIAASQIYFSDKLVNTPQEFLNSRKYHYFDFINFKDEVLKNSIFITEKVIDYVFYLSISEDISVQEKLYKQAINEVIAKVETDLQLKSDLLTAILYNFNQIENGSLMKFVLNKYTKLPKNFQNEKVIKETKSKLKLALGNVAPDFSWEENGETKKLSDLNVADHYILVFWSTTCSHCLHEIPLLYTFSKTLKNVHVVGFTLENDDSGFKKYSKMYPEWTNILGLKRWQNKVARMYEIRATPTYFILDKDKKIVSKPNHFEDVKAFFKN